MIVFFDQCHQAAPCRSLPHVALYCPSLHRAVVDRLRPSQTILDISVEIRDAISHAHRAWRIDPGPGRDSGAVVVTPAFTCTSGRTDRAVNFSNVRVTGPDRVGYFSG
jgi:hypothetical protein